VGEYEILALTPYSYYILDQMKLEYITFHDLISIKNFKSKVLKKYKEFSSLILSHEEYCYLMIKISPLITYQNYSSILCKFFKQARVSGGRVVYITDTRKASFDLFDIRSNEHSAIHYSPYISQTIFIGKRDSVFYLRKKIEKHIKSFSLFSVYLHAVDKIKNAPKLNYDNVFFRDFFLNLPREKIKPLSFSTYDKFKDDFWIQINKSNFSDYVKNRFEKIISQLDESVCHYKNLNDISIKPMTYISGFDEMCRALTYRKNKIPVITFQHGSNIHNNMFLKYGDVYYSDINLSYNEYSSVNYKKLGSKKTIVVGSVLFNKDLCESSGKFDYVYIPYCSNYEYSVNRIDDTSELSMGGYENYERHKYIIEMFGEKFPDKKICIKLQPGIMFGQMYVPLIELSQRYGNVHVESVTPLHKVLSQSKYVISDYFSSDFTNEKIHKCKGIILLNKDEIIDVSIKKDIGEMFTRCDDVYDVENIILNIDELFKKRQIKVKIIEKYSSKVCKTKSIVDDIYKKAYLGV